MASGATPNRWKIIAMQVVALTIAFVAGRYCALGLGDQAASSAVKKVSGKQNSSVENSAVKSATTAAATGSTLTSAKAKLDKILRIQGKFNRERALLDFAAELNPETLKGLLADLEPHITSGNNKDAITVLLGQWAETDLQAALDSWKTIHRDLFPSEDDPSLSIFEAWSANDPAAALAAMAQLPANLREYVTHAILENMIKQDPLAALTALRSQTALRQDFELYGEIFSKLAERDPTTAASSALTLSGNARKSAVESVATYWADKDPAAAMAWAKTLPPGDMRNLTVEQIVTLPALQMMNTQGPQAAIEYLKQLPGNTDYSSTLSTITFNWAQSDPNGLLAWGAKNLSAHDFNDAAQSAICYISVSDPAAAATALAQLDNANISNIAIQQLAENWARQDAQAALNWALTLTIGDAATRAAATSTILNLWSTQDPAGSAVYIERNLASDPSYGSLVEKAANNWAGYDPQAALAWAQNLPAGNVQTNAVNAAMTQLAEVDPQAALDKAMQLPEANRNPAIEATIKGWAHEVPAQAAAALVNLPSGNELNSATGAVAKSWLSEDPATASQWIDTLPQGPARDSAITQIVTVVGKNDPAGTFTWAASIGDPTIRNKQVVDLVTQWNGINPTAAANAAQKALNLSSLTPEQQAALQKIVAKTTIP